MEPQVFNLFVGLKATSSDLVPAALALLSLLSLLSPLFLAGLEGLEERGVTGWLRACETKRKGPGPVQTPP